MHHQPELDFLASLHEVLCWSYPCHMYFLEVSKRHNVRAFVSVDCVSTWGNGCFQRKESPWAPAWAQRVASCPYRQDTRLRLLREH